MLPRPVLATILATTTLNLFAKGFIVNTNTILRRSVLSASAMAATTTKDPLEELNLPRPLILGSGSFTRKLILNEMGVVFKVIKQPIDERAIGDRLQDNPEQLVLTLAKAKCDRLVAELEKGGLDEELPTPITAPDQGWVVLTGDQVVTHRGRILEKPESIEQAKQFVSGYGASPPSTVGSCVLTHYPSGTQVCGVDTATIHFRPTIADKVDGKDLVDRLLEDNNAPILDCAGGLMVEHELVQQHLDRIDGTQDSVMGLSKDLVLRLSRELQQKLQEAP